MVLSKAIKTEKTHFQKLYIL